MPSFDKEKESQPYLDPGADMSAALDLGGVGIWRWGLPGDSLQWTRNLEDIHRLPRGSFDGTTRTFHEDMLEVDRERVMAAIEETIANRTPYRVQYRNRAEGEDGPVWIEARGGIVALPDGSEAMTGVCQDVTDRVQVQLELEKRLRQQQAVTSFGSFALGETQIDAILDRAVETVSETLGVPFAKILELDPSGETLFLKAGVGWQAGLVGSFHAGVEAGSQAGLALASGKAVIVDDLETEVGFDGLVLLRSHGIRSGVSVIIAGENKRPYGVLGAHTREIRGFDSADADFLLAIANIVANRLWQERINERRAIIMREMTHRFGNMFQLVQSLFKLTVAENKDLAKAVRDFGGRLQSLAAAHSLISHDGWTSTRVIELVDAATSPFPGRFVKSGADSVINANLAFDLGLVLHELVTNSSKYGTLSQDEGVVEIAWRIETREGNEIFVFEWRDRAKPSRKKQASGTGFGSRLIESLLHRKWGGTTKIERESGYVFRTEVPISNLTQGL